MISILILLSKIKLFILFYNNLWQENPPVAYAGGMNCHRFRLGSALAFDVLSNCIERRIPNRGAEVPVTPKCLFLPDFLGKFGMLTPDPLRAHHFQATDDLGWREARNA